MIDLLSSANKYLCQFLDFYSLFNAVYSLFNTVEYEHFGYQDGKSSPTIEATVGPIPSSEDEEAGITFEAKTRGKLGRHASFENEPRLVMSCRFVANHGNVPPVLVMASFFVTSIHRMARV